jgi:hypothetical protein
MHNRNLKLFIFLSLLSVPSILLAGPPFLTDDPVPTDYKHFELYTSVILDRTDEDYNIDSPSIELDYGLIPNIEIDITVLGSLTLPRHIPNPRQYGLGDTELASTLRFVQETDHCPQIAFTPSITFPTGDENRGLGNGRPSKTFPFWAEKSWGPWTFDAGGGYTLNSAPDMLNYFFGGILLQHTINKKITLGGEIFGQGDLSPDEKSTTILNIGGNYNFTDAFSLLFSAGHSILGANNLVSYIGLYWTW